MVGVVDADGEGRISQGNLWVEHYPDGTVSHHLSSVGHPIIDHIGLQHPSIEVQINSYKRIGVTSHTHWLTKLQIYDRLIVLCPCGGSEGQWRVACSHIGVTNLTSAIVDVVVSWTLSDTGKVIEVGIAA